MNDINDRPQTYDRGCHVGAYDRNPYGVTTPAHYDAQLGDRVLAQVHDEPKRYSQDMYAAILDDWDGDTYSECGTSYCIGGWAAQLSGIALYDLESRTWLDERGRKMDPFTAGRLALGLGPTRAMALFSGANDLERVEQLMKHYANNPDDYDVPTDPRVDLHDAR